MSGKSLHKLLEEVDQKKAQLDAYRPLSGELIKELNNWFKVEITYSSLALEGNILTSAETASIIERDLPIEGKSLREHLEAVGHASAYEYILDLAKCNRCDLTLQDVLYIHYLVFDNINKLQAGINRNVELELSTTMAPYRPQLKYHEAMAQFLEWLHQASGHPIVIATEAHFKLIMVQPFPKGNGITARLLMNLILLQNGYEPAIIWPKDEYEYATLITTADKSRNLEPLSAFIAQQVIDSYDLYLSKVKPTL